MARTRHDFTAQTVEILRKRVGYLCSNPDCRKHTVGPNADPEKATIVGVAAHITAASPGGPRYNVSMTEKERKSIENGIWLCVNCSTIIDKDPDSFPIDLLKSWKISSEQQLSDKLKGIIAETVEDKKLAFLEVDLIWTGGMRLNRGYSEKNKEIYGDAPIWAGSPLIIHWELKWVLSLVIYNNSNFNAYNLSIEQNGNPLVFEPLPKINNLPALGNIDLEGTYRNYFEGDHSEADILLRNKIPKEVVGTEYTLTYTDDTRNQHMLSFIITEDGVTNKCH